MNALKKLIYIGLTTSALLMATGCGPLSFLRPDDSNTQITIGKLEKIVQSRNIKKLFNGQKTPRVYLMDFLASDYISDHNSISFDEDLTVGQVKEYFPMAATRHLNRKENYHRVKQEIKRLAHDPENGLLFRGEPIPRDLDPMDFCAHDYISGVNSITFDLDVPNEQIQEFFPAAVEDYIRMRERERNHAQMLKEVLEEEPIKGLCEKYGKPKVDFIDFSAHQYIVSKESIDFDYGIPKEEFRDLLQAYIKGELK